jgi:hypothetical protein
MSQITLSILAKHQKILQLVGAHKAQKIQKNCGAHVAHIGNQIHLGAHKAQRKPHLQQILKPVGAHVAQRKNSKGGGTEEEKEKEERRMLRLIRPKEKRLPR